jgi:5-methylcytosine-specific restriction protein A
MPLPPLDRADVLAAIAEIDRLGRDRVLEDLSAHGFRGSRDYFVAHGGEYYDSKPVLALAARNRTGITPNDDEFEGGNTRAAAVLRGLGFTVTAPSPPWDWDELVLACDLVAANGWRELTESRTEVVELSRLLQQLSPLPPEARNPRFRSPGAVSRKTADIVTSDAGYAGTATRGNHLDSKVLQAFRSDAEAMHERATELRALAASGEDTAPLPDLDLDAGLPEDAGAEEGGRVERWRVSRERDPALRSRKLAQVRKTGQPIACEACDFDFGSAYGQRGRDYIEVHHRVPLHVSGEVRTKLSDLALLCSNCHRVVHRQVPWLTVENLTDLVAQHRRDDDGVP